LKHATEAGNDLEMKRRKRGLRPRRKGRAFFYNKLTFPWEDADHGLRVVGKEGSEKSYPMSPEVLGIGRARKKGGERVSYFCKKEGERDILRRGSHYLRFYLSSCVGGEKMVQERMEGRGQSRKRGAE